MRVPAPSETEGAEAGAVEVEVAVEAALKHVTSSPVAGQKERVVSSVQEE